MPHPYLAPLTEKFTAALAETMDASVVSHQPRLPFDDRQRLDLLLTLQTDAGPTPIAVALLRTAYPRDVRDAIWQLDEFKLSRAAPAGPLVTMVVAETLSPGARALLRKRGHGYFDADGSLYLRQGPWRLDIQRPAQARPTRSTADLFTPSREMAIHALLHRRGGWMTGAELSAMAKTSSYTCSLVLQELERREWVESRGAGRTLRRRLTRPDELLDAWAIAWCGRAEARSRWSVGTRGPEDLLTGWVRAADPSVVEARWSVTGIAAAGRTANWPQAITEVEVIVPPGSSAALAAAFKLQPDASDAAANVTLIERSGASWLFRQPRPEVPAYLASPLIQYLDLLAGPAPHPALAAHFRSQVLDF